MTCNAGSNQIRVPAHHRRKNIAASDFPHLQARVPGAAQRGAVRCRPGIVTPTAFATVPDQRCTASLTLALHRIRDTLLNSARVPSAQASLRHHPAKRSHGHRDVAGAGDGSMRACAIACHASRCARMSSSAVLSSASCTSASATRCLSSAFASEALGQGIRDRALLSEEDGATASIS